MSKKNSKKEINISIKNIPKLVKNKNFKEFKIYENFFDEIIPVINYLLGLSTIELNKKNTDILNMYIEYYIIVFNDFINNYTNKPTKIMIETYSKIAYYASQTNNKILKHIITDFYNPTSIKVNKIDISTNTGKELKACKAGYVRNLKTNKCEKKKFDSIQSIYFGPFETPKGMKKGSKKEALKFNQVCMYGIEKLTDKEVKELNKLHNKKK